MCTYYGRVLSRASPWLVFAMVIAGCGGTEPPAPTAAAEHQLAPGQFAIIDLNTFVNKSLQIDSIGAGPGDANLMLGNDPADNTLSANLPAGGPGEFIDWQDLVGDIKNHGLPDRDDELTGRDTTAFPGSNECVGPANVLSKMDLMYVGAMSNNQFVYLAVARSANNGDAGYYWVFTRKQPRMMAGEAPCGAVQHRLVYDVMGPDPATGAGGDVLIAGHFQPSNAPLLRVYMATRDATGVSAVDAVNYNSSLWKENPAGVAAIAVNTTVTGPGGWETKGMKSMMGPNLGPTLFAEAAVPLTVFTGGSSCGAVYWGSVITRSSGSGGTSPDLKDLAGPARFNFGNIKVEARLTATCGLDAGFELVSALGADGQPIANPACEWTFDDGGSATTCNGTHAFAATGQRTGTVKVTDPVTGCGETVSTAPVGVYLPLAVEARLIGGCASQFGYEATITGGSPAGVGYDWTFAGAGPVVPPTSKAPGGTANIVVGGGYAGDVLVTDLRTDGLVCTATGHGAAAAYNPLAVGLDAVAQPPLCPGMGSDAVAFQAVATGGDGNYVYDWVGVPCVGPACVVDPSDSSFCMGPVAFHVRVNDGSGLCAAKDSTPKTYHKITTITVN